MKVIKDIVYFISVSLLVFLLAYLAVNLVFIVYGWLFRQLTVDAYKAPVSYTSLRVVNSQSDYQSHLQAVYLADKTSTEYLQPVCAQLCLEYGSISD